MISALTARSNSTKVCAKGSSPRGRRRLVAARAPSQAIVEFGLVVLLFVLLISGMFDFGISLNARLSISSLSRVLARAAAEGASDTELDALANAQGRIIGVTTDPFAGTYCCDPRRCHRRGPRHIAIKTPTASCTTPAGLPQPGDRVVIERYRQGPGSVHSDGQASVRLQRQPWHTAWFRSASQTTMRIEP